MKKTILAVVTTSLFAASANAAVVYDKDGQQVGVYGELRYVAGQKANDANGDAENFGGTGRARFGFDGKQATGYNDVALISKLEWEAVSEDDNGEENALQSRYAWLGADFANGVQATVGEVQSPFAELSDVTDTYNTYSGLIENQFDDIWDDSAKVTYAADGWDLRAAYSFDDAAKANNEDTKAQYKYSAAAGYTIQIDEVSSLKPVIAYQEADGETAGVDYKDSQYAAGLGYSYDAFYLATTYGQVKHDTDTTDATKDTVWAVTTSYKVLPEWTLVAGYGLVDPHNYGEETEKYYVLGTQYDITAKAKAFAEYKINDIAGQDDNYVVGLQYNF